MHVVDIRISLFENHLEINKTHSSSDMNNVTTFIKRKKKNRKFNTYKPQKLVQLIDVKKLQTKNSAAIESKTVQLVLERISIE